jgi:hypothetical protein
MDCFVCQGDMVRDLDDNRGVICVECGYKFLDPDCIRTEDFTDYDEDEEC